jgi:hypothetical protein
MTKIQAGEYLYRGFAISHLYSEAYREWCWYITNADGSGAGFDPVPTLRQAKLAIEETT